MVDLHGRTTPAMAIRFGQALAPYDLWFLEEPCQPGSADAVAEVARALPIPVATGERLTTPYRPEPSVRVYHDDGSVGDW